MGDESKKEFCIECRHDTEYVLKKKMISKTIKDREYSFLITTAICAECGAEMSLPGLIDKNIKEIEEQYRNREMYKRLTDSIELALDKADFAAEYDKRRMTHDEVFRKGQGVCPRVPH